MAKRPVVITEDEPEVIRVEMEDADSSARTLPMSPRFFKTFLDMGARKSKAAEVCSCGNVFRHNAVFCRRCGARRNASCEGKVTTLAPPILIVSHTLSRTCRCFASVFGSRRADRRFLDRDAVFGQSKGHWSIVRCGSASVRRSLWVLFLKDIYHTFLDIDLKYQLLCYALVHFLWFMLFAPVYLAISDRCNLGLEGHFKKAYYLSLETMVTIGYGVPDQYFNDCWEGVFVLTIQSLLQIFLNAIIIGSIFLKITRPQARANTILFSRQALLRQTDGAVYFTFQACETKNTELLNPKIRCYAICYDGTTFRSFPMRLQQPDDEQGSQLLMKLPHRVVHRIDRWSPLAPASMDDEPGMAVRARWPQVSRRQVDADQGDQVSCMCFVCGSPFQTASALQRHVDYYAPLDEAMDLPMHLRHVSRPTSPGRGSSASPGTREEVQKTKSIQQDLQRHLARCQIEVVVLIEGIEPTTSLTVQARHSYLIPEDVTWDKMFADCVNLGTEESSCTLDLGRFHDLVAVEAGGRGGSMGQVASLSSMANYGVNDCNVRGTRQSRPPTASAGGASRPSAPDELAEESP